MSRRKEKYNHYYGIPHCHTSYSGGKGLPSDAFKYAKNKKLDYLIITDHMSKINGKSSNKGENKWESIIRQSTKFNSGHKRFLALYGFECGSKMFGHINVYNSEDYFSGVTKSKENFYKKLEEHKDSILCINHPGKGVLKTNYDEKLDEYINFVEIGNGAPPYKYNRYEEIVFALLDKGWHLGVFNGQDNHKENWGDRENLTVVISKGLDKKSFLEAFINRRVYSTESKHLKMVFKINDFWMGSIINKVNFNRLDVFIEIEDKKNKINEIQVISNNGEIIKSIKYNKKSSIKEKIIVDIKGEHGWYMLKVMQEQNKIAYSSPIFVE